MSGSNLVPYQTGHVVALVCSKHSLLHVVTFEVEPSLFTSVWQDTQSRTYRELNRTIESPTVAVRQVNKAPHRPYPSKGTNV